MRRFLLSAFLASVAATAMAETPAGPVAPIVVELFTSQGCSSCPPADARLAKLAERPDVVALGFHVDYWDRLGWKDPYASQWATRRQYAYASALRARNVYTPQMLIDGRFDAVGSRGIEVDTAVAEALADRTPRVPVAISLKDGRLRIEIGAGEGAATVLLATYDRRHVTKVAAGENGGATLGNSNVVRSLTALGAWTGTAASYEIPAPGAQGFAVLVQQGDGQAPGRILGAGKLEL